MLRIPDRLAHTVVSVFGEVGRDWLARLPSLVAGAASAWQLEVGAPFEPGGNVGWVAPVRRADGSDAVLKVECPGHHNPWAAKALRHWAGRGAARLLDSDQASQAFLLERPVDRGVVARADELFASLTSSSTDTTLLHGDLGPGNAVLSERGWLAVDPYPALGDRAFDVRQVLSLRDLRDAREQVARFADRLDLDARRIAGWTFATCVEFALRARSVGDARKFRTFLDRAEQLSSQRLV